MMDKIIKFISKDYNFHAKSFKFGFFSEFRVINRLWLLAFGLWQPHKKGYVFYLS